MNKKYFIITDPGSGLREHITVYNPNTLAHELLEVPVHEIVKEINDHKTYMSLEYNNQEDAEIAFKAIQAYRIWLRNQL